MSVRAETNFSSMIDFTLVEMSVLHSEYGSKGNGFEDFGKG